MAFCITRLKRAHRYPQLCFLFSVLFYRVWQRQQHHGHTTGPESSSLRVHTCHTVSACLPNEMFLVPAGHSCGKFGCCDEDL